ncbi:putative Ser/Thr protein kinase [Thermocatellispora tengchongensis]|uniref:Putative Ser/Thr protein kinase n=1 Tax=Thermocatellispora tengchongensis TaxID=1073253 RepID=A0A840PPQ9_9ACTN|nr:serine/threonine-protein kinase [Thermocatellispora tengchongensis]MBB5140053.1 putative Ser/Thr protein kinase [Thermocatellispora tengchongensis]
MGEYRLTARLGEGGQGVVYLGVAPNGAKVAVKLLRPEMAGDEEALERFVREVAVAQRVAPFCTAAVLDTGIADQRPYIVSEFIEGPTLDAVVRSEGPRSGSSLHRLAIGTVTALVAIHQAGIVHRDFKPSNVILAPDGPRVIDFGIARALDRTSTLTAMAVGTPSYMTPEQIAGHGIVPATDMFAWGCVMVFAANGAPPFGTDTLPAVFHRILSLEPDLSMITDPSLRELVGECLAKEAAERPTAEQALLRLLGQNTAPRGVPQQAAPLSGPGGPLGAPSAILAQGSAVAAERTGGPYGEPPAPAYGGPPPAHTAPGYGPPYGGPAAHTGPTGFAPGHPGQTGHTFPGQGPVPVQAYAPPAEHHGYAPPQEHQQQYAGPPPDRQAFHEQPTYDGRQTYAARTAPQPHQGPPPQQPGYGPPPQGGGTPGKRLWLVAGALFGVALLAGGGIAIVANSGDETKPDDKVTTASRTDPPTAPVSSPPPSVPPVAEATRRFKLPGTNSTLHESDEDPIRLTSYSLKSGESLYTRKYGSNGFDVNKVYFDYTVSDDGTKALGTDRQYTTDNYSVVSLIDRTTGKKTSLKLTKAPIYPTLPQWSRDGELGLVTLYRAVGDTSKPYGYAVIDIDKRTARVVRVKETDAGTWSYFWRGDGRAVGTWALKGDTKRIRFYDLHGTVLATLLDVGEPLTVESDDISPSGKLFMTYCRGTTEQICLWSTDGDAEAVARIPFATDRVVGWWDDQHIAAWRKTDQGGYEAVVVDFEGNVERVLATATAAEYKSAYFRYTRQS